MTRAIEVPDGIVVHQVPVTIPDGPPGTVVRVYGVEDDPKEAIWLGQPLAEQLERLGSMRRVGRAFPKRSGFCGMPICSRWAPPADAWRAARWLMGLGSDYSLEEWRKARRFSLATSAQWADMQPVSESHMRRMQSAWKRTAISLARSGTDIQPLLANAPGILALADAGRAEEAEASRVPPDAVTTAASQYYRASLFFAKAGLVEECRTRPGRGLRTRPGGGECGRDRPGALGAGWRVDPAGNRGRGAAPHRPGRRMVRYAALLPGLGRHGSEYRGRVERPLSHPHHAPEYRRAGDPLFGGRRVRSRRVFSTAEQVLAPADPGSPYTIPRLALVLAGIIKPGQELRRVLRARGGGLEIATVVDLPMGSGLGTSSILAATVVRALAEMCGVAMSEAALTDEVMRLEQMMTTGGGWQDQAGGIFPGAKMVTSGPGPAAAVAGRAGALDGGARARVHRTAGAV